METEGIHLNFTPGVKFLLFLGNKINRIMRL